VTFEASAFAAPLGAAKTQELALCQRLVVIDGVALFVDALWGWQLVAGTRR
jgi:hypothetical protein